MLFWMMMNLHRQYRKQFPKVYKNLMSLLLENLKTTQIQWLTKVLVTQEH